MQQNHRQIKIVSHLKISKFANQLNQINNVTSKIQSHNQGSYFATLAKNQEDEEMMEVLSDLGNEKESRVHLMVAKHKKHVPNDRKNGSKSNREKN